MTNDRVKNKYFNDDNVVQQTVENSKNFYFFFWYSFLSYRPGRSQIRPKMKCCCVFLFSYARLKEKKMFKWKLKIITLRIITVE